MADAGDLQRVLERGDGAHAGDDGVPGDCSFLTSGFLAIAKGEAADPEKPLSLGHWDWILYTYQVNFRSCQECNSCRNRTRLTDGNKITDADAILYMHEIAEIMIKEGLDYRTAHLKALQKCGVTPLRIYAPEVIKVFSSQFNGICKKSGELVREGDCMFKINENGLKINV